MRNFRFIVLFMLLGCNSRKSDLENEISFKDTSISEQQLFLRAYDITDLKLHTDTTASIFRFATTKKYNHIFWIEMIEANDYISLCLKQPLLLIQDNVNMAESRRLPFNQICHIFGGQEADSIRKSFLHYTVDGISRDIKCETCLDNESWVVESEYKGKYSSITKDYYSFSDSALIELLFSKFEISKNNGYRLEGSQ